MSKDRCNIEGIKGLTSEASIQIFHFFVVVFMECPPSSVPTDTSHIYYKSFKSSSGISVDTYTLTEGDRKKKVHTVNHMDHILQYHMI